MMSAVTTLVCAVDLSKSGMQGIRSNPCKRDNLASPVRT